MSRDSDIRSKITYMQGPHGQTVVLVPSKQELPEAVEDTFLCTCCAVLCTTLGISILVIGIIFLGIHLSTGPARTRTRDDFFIATISLLGIGAFFVVITIPMFYSLSDYHRSQVARYMHRDNLEERQPVLRQEEVFSEEVDPEAFAISYEMYNPTESEVPVNRIPARNHRENYLPGYHGIPMESVRAEASRRGMYSHPSQRSNTSCPYHAPEGGDSYFGHQHRQFEGRSSPSQNILYYPGRAQPGRTSPGRTYPGTASPHYSSPGGERSFSPSSDTTYLSYHSSVAEGQSGNRT